MELKPWPKGKKKAAAAKAAAPSVSEHEPEHQPKPLVVANIQPPNPERPSKPTPETHPHLFDEFGNPR